MRPNIWSVFRQSSLKIAPQEFRILLNDREFLAIEKPYSFPLKSDHHDIASLESHLQSLSAFHKSDLFPIEGSGITSNLSGVLLFAKNKHVLCHIEKLYNEHKVTERYHTILLSSPDIDRGEIRVPIRPICQGLSSKITCVPDYSAVYKDRSYVPDDVLPAISIFYVVSKMPPPPPIQSRTFKNYSTRSRASLCLFRTSTCFKDQIRCHSDEILNCPILGDHKYSKNKDMPQELPKFMLRLLKLHNSWDTKTLPMFLHLSEISFESPADSMQQIIIKCPLPEFFTTGLSLLQLKMNQ